VLCGGRIGCIEFNRWGRREDATLPMQLLEDNLEALRARRLFSPNLGCWMGRREAGAKTPSLAAMLIYNLLVTPYLVYLGIGGPARLDPWTAVLFAG
jgi:hypothetical protein